MKDHPILFSGEMVRKILDGTKTQTRRVVKTRYTIEFLGGKGDPINDPHYWGYGPCDDGSWAMLMSDGEFDTWQIHCPYGWPGERLWVRENFYVQPELWAINHDRQPVHYAANTRREEVEDYVLKPLIHMPHWASRIMLEVTEVRVQRIQEISEQDAIAEGCNVLKRPDEIWWQGYDSRHRDVGGNLCHTMRPGKTPPDFLIEPKEMCIPDVLWQPPQMQFRRLWDSINAAKRGFPWDSNPWVWVIAFQVFQLEANTK